MTELNPLKKYVYRLLISQGMEDSGFLQEDFFKIGVTLRTVDEYWEHQDENRKEETKEEFVESAVDDEDKEKSSSFWSASDDTKKSWLFLLGSAGVVVFYIGWYKNIRIQVEFQ